MAVGDSGAVFTEVLQLSIDTTQFDADLQKVMESWDAAMKLMGESAQNSGVSKIFDSGAISADIKDLQGQIQELSASIGEAFGGVTENIVSNTEQMSSAFTAMREQFEAFRAETSQSGRGRSSEEGGLVGEIFGSITSMMRWIVLWKLVSETINGLVAIVKSPFTAWEEIISSGVGYLSQLQDKSAEIRATLMQTVKLAGDQADQFKEAGHAADLLVKKLEELAIRSDLKPENLMSGFQAFMTSGGAHLVDQKDLFNQSADVSAALANALKLSGTMMSARQIAREISAFVSEQSNANSPLLHALNLTVGQAQALVQHARQYHDLLPQIEQRLVGVVDKLKDADQRHNALVELAETLLHRWEAIVAGPVLEKFDTLLRSAINWFLEHQGAVDEFGKRLGNVVAVLLTGTQQFLNQNWRGLADVLHLIAQSFVNVTTNIEDTVNAAEALIQMARGAKQIAHGDLFGGTETQKEAFSGYWSRRSEIMKAADEASASLDKLFKGDSGSLTSSNNINAQLKDMAGLIKGLFATSTPGDVSKIKEAFEAEREAIRNATQANVDAIKQSVTDRTISLKEGTEQLVAAYKNEADKLRNAVAEFTKQAQESGAPQKNVEAAVSAMQKALSAVESATDRAETAAKDQYTKQQQGIAKANYAELERLALEHQRAMLAIFKQQAAEGLHTHAEVFQQEIALQEDTHRRRMDLIREQLREAGSDEAAKAAAQRAQTGEQQRYSDEVTARPYAQRQAGVEDARDQLREEQENAKQTLDTTKLKLIAAKELAITEETRLKVSLALLDAERRYAQERQANDEKHLAVLQKMGADKELISQAGEKVAADKLQTAEIISQIQDTYRSHDFFGRNFDKDGNATTTPFGQEFQKTADNLNEIFKELTTTVAGTIRGFREGGTLGGLGAAAGGVGGILEQAGTENSPMNQLFGALGVGTSALGPIGAGLSLVGSLFSGISKIFQQAAVDIGNEVKKTFDTIMNEYRTGNINLITAIQKLQKERQDAINQLSGIKGGDKQLQQLLPQIDNTLAQLKAQQIQTLEQFNNTVFTLRSSALGDKQVADNFKYWADAFKQAKEAFGAGAKPQQVIDFLNLSKQQEVLDLQTKYNQGEMSAIQNAFNLNSLLMQRQQIMNQINKLEMGTQDSLERREAGAVRAGRQAALQKEQLQYQLQAVNEQIQVAQAQWDSQKKIFGLTDDIATLHKIDANLQISAGNQQLEQYREMLAIIKQISNLNAQMLSNGTIGFGGPRGLGGWGGGVPGFGATNAPQPVQHVINVGPIHVGPGVDGRHLGNTLAEEIMTRLRTGRNIYGTY